MLGIHRPAISLSPGRAMGHGGDVVLSACLRHIGILSDFDSDLALHFYKEILHMGYNHPKDTRSGVVLHLCLTLKLRTSDLSITLTVGSLWTFSLEAWSWSSMCEICFPNWEMSVYNTFPNVVEVILSPHSWWCVQAVPWPHPLQR